MGDDSADDKSAATGVPSWQRSASTSTPTAAETAQPTTETTDSREQLLEHARKFLLEDEVQQASTEKQIAFLEKKGLRPDEIKQLLGVERNAEASNTAVTTDHVEPQRDASAQSSTVAATATSPSGNKVLVTRDIPPIVTYPEFLTKPARPAPLVSAQRLLMILYFFSSASLACYGTSRFLVSPMVESLTAARHSLSETTQAKLDGLVARLLALVSTDPGLPAAQKMEDDDESSDGDPTELFHRDIGVQTDPPVSPTTASPPATAEGEHPLEYQMKRLSILRNRLHNLVDNDKGEAKDHQIISTTLTGFKEYLDGLTYIPPAYGYSTGGLYPTGTLKTTGEMSDEISQIKAQIRGVKGLMLAARSFPAGVRGVR